MIVRPQAVDALRLGASGRLEINPDRILVQSWLQGTTRNERVSIAASGQARDSIEVQQENNLAGDALWTRFTSDQLGPYRVELQRLGSEPQAFMNVPIRSEFICGFSDDPFYLPCPIYVEARSGLEVTFTNLAASTTNQIRFKAHGERYLAKSQLDLQRLRVSRFDPRQKPFWLGLDDTTTTLSASATDVHENMTVPSDGDFEVEGMWVRAQGPFYLKISENLGGRPIMNGGGRNQVVVYSEHFGGGVYFHRFPAGPAFFQRLSTLDLQFNNFLAAQNVVEVVLVGRILAYPAGSYNPGEFAAPTPVAALENFNPANGQRVAPSFMSFLGAR